MNPPPVIAKGAIVACPACSRRTTIAVPTISAICRAYPNGKTHPPEVMRVVDEVDAS